MKENILERLQKWTRTDIAKNTRFGSNRVERGEGKRSTVLKPTDLKDKIFSKQKKCFYKFDHKQQFFDLSTDMSFICSEFVVPFRLQNNEEHLRGRP